MQSIFSATNIFLDENHKMVHSKSIYHTGIITLGSLLELCSLMQASLQCDINILVEIVEF